MIDKVVTYFLDFSEKVSTEYHVNPWIFIILFFGSAIPLYYGYYVIGKSAVKLEGHKLKKRENINRSELKLGIIIACVAWVLPYLYVALVGKLPLKIWLIFSFFVLIMGILFIQTLRSKVRQAKQKNNK